MPKKISAKNKIVILAAAWLILSALMFLYFFKILDGQNQQTLTSMATERQNLAALQNEDESFKQAQADLQKLAAQPYQPDNFFSRDVTLVDEIESLDNLGQKYNLQMQISGVSGTADSEPPANTKTPIVMVPFGITLSGSLQNVVSFIENMENLDFVTTLGAVSISSGTGVSVNANLSGNFYLQK